MIGSGPGGLSCAYYLAVEGYSVSVFEKEKMLGGMLLNGIPSFRLEKNVVRAEIEILEELGVEFKTGIEIGKDITLEELRKEGYLGFYVASGDQGGRSLGIEGEDLIGVSSGVTFLKEINEEKLTALPGKTVVIGGGNVAIDVARAAARVGDSQVSMYCLEELSMMPASREEIEEAREENIAIENGWGPAKILAKDGKVSAIIFKRCKQVFDESGRFAPQYDENDCITVEVDNIIVSVGQSIEWGDLLKGTKAEWNPNRTVKADAFTYQTGEPDVFVGGDCFTGPKFAIDAIAAGKQGAISLHRFVNPGQSLVIGRDRREYVELNKESVIIEQYDNTPRQKPDTLDSINHKEFLDKRGIFNEEQLKKEASRCLGCGVTLVDQYMCVGCGQCTTKCKFDAIHLKKRYEGEGVEFTEMKPVVVKQVLKRKGKIAIKKVKRAVGIVK